MGIRAIHAATIMVATISGHIVAAQRVPLVAFDVASIRRVDSTSITILSWTGRGELVGKATLETLIHRAYEVETYERIVGANPMVAGRLEELYEVKAKSPARIPPYTSAEGMLMLRGLLAERFNLKIRIDNELANVTVLRAQTPRAHGRALRPAPEGCEPLPAVARPEDPRFQAAYVRNCRITYFDEHVRGTVTLDEFARMVSFLAQRPILNRTDLEGIFAIDVTIGRASFPPPPCSGCGPRVAAEVNDGPAFVDALRDQMGLTARGERQPLRLFVVEEIGPFVEN